MGVNHRVTEAFSAALSGSRRGLARAITLVENRTPGINQAIASLEPRRLAAPGGPHVLGITGPPGAGKSTFTNRIVEAARAEQRTVAVVAVDPSSPFSGGAILGDRLRMEQHAGDEGVFVRSVASRGHLGGLARAAGQIVDLLDAVGFDLVVVETVGVGQSELSIMEVADTVLVVLTPESGDVVQTMKAGLLEIADMFVVNKADRPGAERLRINLEQMVELEERGEGQWRPPVWVASALQNEGVDSVTQSAQAHLAHCVGPGRGVWEHRRGAGRVRTFLDLVAEDARAVAVASLKDPDSPLRVALQEGRVSPYQAAAERESS